jgi:uncharacterized YigZ family protein
MKKVVPYKELENEIIVVNSRFIASLSPAASVDEAREYIKVIKARYADASHHVPAYVIGYGSSVIAHCSDDGEPSGTAGRPALAVLQGSGIGDTVVVVTRYFGGTKLGKGGLVRAYSDAVREVLKDTSLAEIVLTDVLQVRLDYPFYEPISRLLTERKGIVEHEEFTADVQLRFRISSEAREMIIKEIQEKTAGRAHVEILCTDEEFRRKINQSIFEVSQG